ncbi:MAG: hypothetical protein JO202_18525, partial [Ktedonobacteraceae bacterium]|nr:hypothetical protein [Ktedonobacteraceae bacterium]
MTESRMFGDYGPFRVGPDGLPLFADVVAFFLERNGWSKKQFGYLYGRAARDKPFTERWVQMQVKASSFPDDGERRWVIANLLNIPPALLGVTHLDELLTHPQMPDTPVEKSTAIDLAEYRARLPIYWKQQNTHTAAPALKHVLLRLKRLHSNYFEVAPESRTKLVRLLFDYHHLAVRISSDLQQFTEAIVHLNKAYAIARFLEDSERETLTLFRRGYILLEKGDAATALVDFTAARSLERKISAPLRGSILLGQARTLARAGQDNQDLKQAQHWMDDAGTVLSASKWADAHFIHFDQVWYHLERATGLLASPSRRLRFPREALAAVDTAFSLATNTAQLSVNRAGEMLQAKAYLDQGYYPIATTLAHNALHAAKDVPRSVASIARICDALKESSYR